MRLHTIKGELNQVVQISTRIDTSVQALLGYISQIAQCPPNFINIFHRAKKLGNSDVLYKENIMDGDKMLCLQGQGDLHHFYRFKSVSASGWCYSGTSWDAITWRPNRSIMIAGFGVYGLTSGQSNFFCKYKYVVNNTPSDELDAEITNNEVDETSKIYTIMFDEMIEVAAGTDFIV